MKTGRWILLSIALTAGVPASAQTSDRQLGEALLSTSSAGPPAPPRPRKCDADAAKAADSDIVVCAGDLGQRIAPTSESDPASRAGLRNGELHAPELGRGSCRGQLGCFIGGGTIPPAYIIDMKAIPEAPAGSDADRIAKGELRQP